MSRGGVSSAPIHFEEATTSETVHNIVKTSVEDEYGNRQGEAVKSRGNAVQRPEPSFGDPGRRKPLRKVASKHVS